LAHGVSRVPVHFHRIDGFAPWTLVAKPPLQELATCRYDHLFVAWMRSDGSILAGSPATDQNSVDFFTENGQMAKLPSDGEIVKIAIFPDLKEISADERERW
jgi:hypothetical protein